MFWKLVSVIVVTTSTGMASPPSVGNSDNSAVNKQHVSTADNQSQAPRDLEITRRIREQLAANEKLSTYAENVKIITESGKVVLKGPVRSELERQTVQKIAADVAGAEAVRNELTIAPRN